MTLTWGCVCLVEVLDLSPSGAQRAREAAERTKTALDARRITAAVHGQSERWGFRGDCASAAGGLLLWWK